MKSVFILFTHLMIGVTSSPPSPYAPSGMISFNLDYWPNDTKLDSSTASSSLWKDVSVLNIDLDKLKTYMSIFEGAIIRVGGAFQDRITYIETDKSISQCTDSIKLKPGSTSTFPSSLTSSTFQSSYTDGCIDTPRIKQLADFAKATNTKFIWGLNVLKGRRLVDFTNQVVKGSFDNSNAIEFLTECRQQGLPLHGVTLGEALYGKDSWADLSPNDAHDVYLKVKDAFAKAGYPTDSVPLIIGMDSFLDDTLEARAITSHDVDIYTYHDYIIDGGNDMTRDDVAKTVLDMHKLEENLIPRLDAINTIRDRYKNIKMPVSVGEAGGCFKGGCKDITNKYISGYWYLHHLALSAHAGFINYSRHALAGGYYGLLSSQSLQPTPDYYMSILWNKLIGAPHHIDTTTKDSPPMLDAIAVYNRNATPVLKAKMSDFNLWMPTFYESFHRASYKIMRTPMNRDVVGVPNVAVHFFWHKTLPKTLVAVILNHDDAEYEVDFSATYFQGDVTDYTLTPRPPKGRRMEQGMKLSNLRSSTSKDDVASSDGNKNPLFAGSIYFNEALLQLSTQSKFDTLFPSRDNPIDCPIRIPPSAYQFLVFAPKHDETK